MERDLPPQSREVLIRSGAVAIRARLNSTAAAGHIWDSLPIYGVVQTWGREVYFTAPPMPPQTFEPAGLRDVIDAGDIAFWPQGSAISIPFGPTPVSRAHEIRMANPSHVWARSLDDVGQLKGLHAGDPIAVLAADS